jgi:enoyl-CoA hydratase/carnithine racemase
MTGAVEKETTASLRVERSGGVATVLIDNARRRNALSQDMWQQFKPILDELEADSTVKVVVVRGAGENFSAGADISDLLAILHDPESGVHDGGHVSAGENALASFPKPTVAAIDGYCIGGAWQIAGACDIRLASENATFGITPAKVGIIYPLSGIERLVRLAGPAVAKYLLFTGDFISAPEARDFGLVSRVIPQAGFWDEIQNFADKLAMRSQLSIQATKQIVDAIAVNDPAVPEISNSWQNRMSGSGEAEIGIRAFLAKETPAFNWIKP